MEIDIFSFEIFTEIFIEKGIKIKESK